MSDGIIMYDGLDTAFRSYNKIGAHILNGWWSVDNQMDILNFWGEDEHMARWSGCTHMLCAKCGKNIHSKNFTACEKCRDKAALERYNKLDTVVWDGVNPVYSQILNKYFFCEYELDTHCTENECSFESLRLVSCEPVELSAISSDYWADELLGDDEELPEDVLEAVDALNLAIIASPVGWMPGKKRIIID